MHCDNDLGFSALNYAEILSAAHMNNGGITDNKQIHVRWAMNDKAWCWLGRLTLACLDEQMHRFGVEDEYARGLLRSFTHEDDEFTYQQGLPRFIQLVKYKSIGDPVAAYRGHYIRRRAHASWTRRGPPEWWGNASHQLALRLL
jgi:hypothetical protein